MKTKKVFQSRGMSDEETVRRRLVRSLTWPLSINRCWIWTGTIDSAGYARYTKVGSHAQRGHSVPALASRAMWEIFNADKIPDGMFLDHLCHTNDPSCSGGLCSHRSCVNPFHLEVVTPRENSLRAKNIMTENRGKTYCVNGHLLSGENLHWRLRGNRKWRECITCRREKDRKRQKLYRQQRKLTHEIA